MWQHCFICHSGIVQFKWFQYHKQFIVLYVSQKSSPQNIQCYFASLGIIGAELHSHKWVWPFTLNYCRWWVWPLKSTVSTCFFLNALWESGTSLWTSCRYASPSLLWNTTNDYCATINVGLEDKSAAQVLGPTLLRIAASDLSCQRVKELPHKFDSTFLKWSQGHEVNHLKTASRGWNTVLAQQQMTGQ